MPAHLPPIIVLNGGSSSGCTTVARKLQSELPDVRLLLGVDTFLEALPDWGARGDVGIRFGDDGVVSVDDTYYAREDAWYRTLVALARSGNPLILDEVMLSGGAGQERLKALFGDIESLWIGVRCNADIAEAREQKRPDRIDGMARDQAESVHDGVAYDVEVDTATQNPQECVDAILDALGVF